MNRVLLPLLALLVLASIALPNTAHAYLITVNFAFSYSPADPTYSGPVSGSFSFDSSLIPSTLPGLVQDFTNGVSLSSLDLTLAGHTYTGGTDAILTYVQFDASGNVTGWGLAGTANGSQSVSSNSNDFTIVPGPGATVFYSYVGGNVYGGSFTSWSVTYGTDQAPEPGSLALVAPFLALGLIRRRRS